MSIRILAKVLDSGRYHGDDLLVLLAIADVANDEGSYVRFTEAELARPVGLSTRRVQDAVARLVCDGVLESIEKTNGGLGSTDDWTINVRRLEILQPACGSLGVAK